MNLKNYTTGIKANKTIAEIEESLISHGARDLWKQYDGSQNIISLTFSVITEQGKIPFKLTINPEAVRQIIAEQHKKGRARGISKKQASDMEHARNVGWRILKDWIDAQMALVEIRMRKLEQIFLSDIWDAQSGKTFFEILQEKKFAGMLMEANTKGDTK